VPIAYDVAFAGHMGSLLVPIRAYEVLLTGQLGSLLVPISAY
jgi:hypothetical protein